MKTKPLSSDTPTWKRGEVVVTDFVVHSLHDARITEIHRVPPRYLTGVVATVDEIIDRMMGKTNDQ